MNLSLTLWRDRKLHLVEYHTSAHLLNSLGVVLALLITLLNLLISALDPSAALKPNYFATTNNTGTATTPTTSNRR